MAPSVTYLTKETNNHVRSIHFTEANLDSWRTGWHLWCNTPAEIHRYELVASFGAHVCQLRPIPFGQFLSFLLQTTKWWAEEHTGGLFCFSRFLRRRTKGDGGTWVKGWGACWDFGNYLFSPSGSPGEAFEAMWVVTWHKDRHNHNTSTP